MKNVFTLLFLLFSSVSAQNVGSNLKYMDPDLPLEERVNDLIGRMTLEEKASQMIDAADAIPRLNIPEYNWWNEALHGVARAGTATVFPQAIGLAATWNTGLMYKIADVISTEARAKHHEFARNNDYSRYKGLTFWSPNINIFRDPRWGRGQETYGEDPYLTARLGVEFVKGLQGDDPDYLKVIATPKHYAVHSGPEPDRHTFNAVVDNHDLYDTYLPAFEACIKEGKAFSIMCAYNRFLGDACCGSSKLLQNILRKEWGFKGYVVSDCGAINDIYQNHKIVNSGPEAAAMAIKSGTDLECGRVYKSGIVEAVEKGLLTEQEIDTALKRLFTARFKLGMFDPPEKVKYSKIPFSENDSDEHRELSLIAARESIVLLKNENNLLPLNKNINRIAVIGPTADSYQMLLGNYNGTPSKYVTLFNGIRNKLNSFNSSAEVVYEQGVNLVEEGNVLHNLTSDVLSAEKGHLEAGWRSGLKAEYFKNKNLEGEPFYTRIDPLDNPNFIYGTRIPSLWNLPQFSIRWTGFFSPPSSGRYTFTIKADDGYRLYFDERIIAEDWSEHKGTTSRTADIDLQEGKNYSIKIEYFRQADTLSRPHLSIQWEVADADNFKQAVELAENSDAVIFIGGISPQLEGEEMQVDYEGFRGGDRISLDLPRIQESLLKELHRTGKPVILVLTSGSALSVNWAEKNVPAIVHVWYPGQEGGTALADVLFGDYNPAGRLPVTFYKSAGQLPPFEDYNMKGRTYRYFEEEPLFPFGYGLSYTKFSYSNLRLPDSAKAGTEINISVEVENTGKTAGDEVVQLYVKDIEATVPVPIHSLQGFKRIHLKPGEKKIVEFNLKAVQLSVIYSTGGEEVHRVVEPGEFLISAGGMQPNFKTESTASVQKKLLLTGDPYKMK